MKKIICYSLIFISLQAFSQKLSLIDFDAIKAQTTDVNSIFYYPKLMDRFQNNDSTLKLTDYQYIYYGFIFDSRYNPLDINPLEDSLAKSYKSGQYEKSLLFAKQILESDPVNVEIIFTLSYIYKKMGNSDLATKISKKARKIIATIVQSGDGQTLETGLVVINQRDEYQVANELKLQRSTNLITGNCNFVRYLSPNTFDIESLYFNIEKPLQYEREHKKK